MILAGTVTGDTLVWKQGMVQWVTLDDMRARNPAMFSAVAPPPLPETPAAGVGASELRGGVGEAGGDATPFTRRPMRLEPEEAKPVAPEVPIYAGFWARAGAFVVDFLIWGFVLEIATKLVGVWFFPDAVKMLERIQKSGAFTYRMTPDEAMALAPLYGVLFLVTLVWVVLYDLIFIPRFGATPGKLLFGLRLVTVRNKPLGTLRIVARALARVLSGLPTLFIGFLVAGVDDQKRGLHDFFCGTRVVKKR